MSGVLVRAARTRGLARRVDLLPAHRAAVRSRLRTLLITLGAPRAAEGESTASMLAALAAELDGGPPDRVWLALAVLGGALPDEATVLRAMRAVRLDGPLSAFAGVLAGSRRAQQATRWAPVEVVSGEVLVDVHHTAGTALATGIQRVARRTCAIWHEQHAPTFVGWTPTLGALRRLSGPERDRALHGGPPVPPAAQGPILVPWQCRYLLPELLTEPERATRLLAMLRFSATTGSMIGFDCTPISSAETVADGMSAGFTAMLSAMAWGERIAAISAGAESEFAGWRSALVGTGLAGPRIGAVPLATEVTPAAESDEPAARDLLGAEHLPLVLCVGSHEPRKNHLAVLHAAGLLWQEGLAFALAFVGGNAWHSEEFLARVRAQEEAGHPVRTVHGLPDHLLAAAYRIARCTVFPSLNEGFGLPVAESLAAGTPVLTSRFGSMAAIAAPGGALLVDPRDDAGIVAALRRLLQDDDLHARLSAEARAFPVRSWQNYASETWEFLVTAPNTSADEASPR